MELDPFNTVKWDWTEDRNIAPPFLKDSNGELLSTAPPLVLFGRPWLLRSSRKSLSTGDTRKWSIADLLGSDRRIYTCPTGER
jgi:hypothetical protein